MASDRDVYQLELLMDAKIAMQAIDRMVGNPIARETSAVTTQELADLTDAVAAIRNIAVRFTPSEDAGHRAV